MSVQTSYSNVIAIAGSGRRGFVDGMRHSSYLDGPLELMSLPDGDVLIVDSRNNCLRRISLGTNGTVSTLTTKLFLSPRSPVLIDGGQGVVICDSGHHKIRMIQIDENNPGTVLHDAPIAGTGKPGHHDGTAETAQFNRPSGLCVLVDGSILVADTNNHSVRRISARPGKTGLFVTTVVGGYGIGFEDGDLTTARLNLPSSLLCDTHGTILIVDAGNHALRALHPPPDGDMGSQGWVLTTLVGFERGLPAFADASCASLYGALREPATVASGSDGSLLISDCGNNSIRALVSGGCLTPDEFADTPAGLYEITKRGTFEALHAPSPKSGNTITSVSSLNVLHQTNAGTNNNTLRVPTERQLAFLYAAVKRPEERDDGGFFDTSNARRIVIVSSQRDEHRAGRDGVSAAELDSILLNKLKRFGAPTGNLLPHQLTQVIFYSNPAAIIATHDRYSALVTIAGPKPFLIDSIASAATNLSDIKKSPEEELISRGIVRTGAPDAVTAVKVVADQLRMHGPARHGKPVLDARLTALNALQRYVDGAPAISRFRRPHGLLVLSEDAGGAGCVLVSDQGNHLIRLLVTSNASKNNAPLLADILKASPQPFLESVSSVQETINVPSTLSSSSSSSQAVKTAFVDTTISQTQKVVLLPTGPKHQKLQHEQPSFFQKEPIRQKEDRSIAQEMVQTEKPQLVTNQVVFSKARRNSLTGGGMRDFAILHSNPSPIPSSSSSSSIAALDIPLDVIGHGDLSMIELITDGIEPEMYGRLTNGEIKTQTSAITTAHELPQTIHKTAPTTTSQTAPPSPPLPPQQQYPQVQITKPSLLLSLPIPCVVKGKQDEKKPILKSALLSPSKFQAQNRSQRRVSLADRMELNSTAASLTNFGNISNLNQKPIIAPKLSVISDGPSAFEALAPHLSPRKSRDIRVTSGTEGSKSTTFMRSPNKVAAGTLAAVALSGPSNSLSNSLANDPEMLLDVSAALLAETMGISELNTKYHNSPPRGGLTTTTTTTTGGGSRHASRRSSVVSRTGNVSLVGSYRPLVHGWGDEEKVSGSTYTSMADVSSRDLVAQEEHSATGILVKALLDADEAHTKSTHDASHVTNAPKSLLHARFAKHTASSISHIRGRGLAVSRMAPAFVNVNSLVRMTVARGLQ